MCDECVAGDETSPYQCCMVTVCCPYAVDPLNEEVLGIETMWGRRKADVARRLRPVAKYSQQLKVCFTV